MKPVLFEKDNTNYDHNGIAVLYDALVCTVHEEHNGVFDLDLEYPVNGEWANFITEDRQILAKPNDVDEPHAFRIYDVDKDLEDGVIYVKATSITDDVRGNLIPYVSVTDATAQQALTAIKNGLIELTRFDFISDIDVRATMEWTRINPIQAIAGDSWSVLDIWGGEIKRTNDTIYLYSRRGTDHAMVLRPGKNVDGFRMTTSTKGIVTKILPYYTYTPEALPVYEMVDDGNGNMVKQQAYDNQNSSGTRMESVTLTGAVVESADAHKYPVSQYLPVDYSSDAVMNETVQTFIELKKLEAEISPTPIDVSGFDAELQQFVLDLLNDQASLYFTVNPGVDKASVSFKAEMIQLSDSDEWELYKNLETIKVSDTVDVYVKKFDVDIEVKITAISYDSIGERVLSITAGTARNSLSQSITKPYEDAVKQLEEYVDNMENGVYNTIARTADGQNKRFSGYTEPPDSVSSESDIWYKEIGEGKVELWIYKGGTWAPLISAAVSEAIEQAIENAAGAASDADGKAQGIIDGIQDIVLEDGITTLGDLIASKVSEDDYGTMFFQQSKAIGLVYTEAGVDKAIIMINQDGIPYIKGENIILNGDTIVDGTFTVTDTMLAEDAVVKSLTATGIDAETIRVINLDASSIVGGDLEVTESFRITHNGVPVLEVDAVTGQIKITAPNLATKTDLESLELTPGPTGTGIQSVTEYYLATASATGVTTGTVGWTTGVQTMDATKKYLWNYEVTTYTDNSTRTTTPVIIGRYGDAGKGISSITEYYLASASSTGVTTGTAGWTTAMQSTTDTNKYLWNYEVITYTDSSTTTIAPVVIGTHGAKGDPGKGVSSVTEYYLASPNSTGVTTATVGWSTSIPTIDTTNKYLWNYEKTTYSDSTTVNSTPVVLGAHGANGKGISSITEYYLVSPNSTGVTTGTAGWTTAMQTTTETNKYLWNYEVITYTDSTTSTVAPVIIGTHGSSGKGVSSVTEYYLATASSTGVTTGTAGWTTTIQTIDATKKYLWNYEKTTYSDSSTTNTTPVILGAYGDQGSPGKGISSITEYYLATSASTGVTTGTAGWTTAMQTTTETNKYLWNYEVITYTDSTTSTISPVIIGTHGATGSTGKGISGVTEYYLATNVNSGVTTATSGWATTVPTITSSNKYLWNYEKTTYTDSTSVNSTPVLLGVYGDTGKGISSVTNYYLATAAGSGVTTATAGWTTAMQTMTAVNNYLWNYEVITYTDSSTTTTTPAIIGTKGVDGTTTYTWIKYADDAQGNGMSDLPEGKRYLGIAYNKTSSTESSTKTDYSWSPLYDNVVVGGVNIVKNGTFKDGKTNWENDADFTVIDAETDKPTSKILKLSKSGVATATYFQMWSDVIQIDADGEKEYTLSFDVKTDSVAAIDNYDRLFCIRTFDVTGKSASTDSVYEKMILLSEVILVDGVWKRYKVTFTPTAGKYIRVAPYVDMNGTVYWREIQLESGNIATDWTAHPEDKDNLYTWIKYADDVNGTGITDDPTGKEYIGIAYNKDTSTESGTASDYTWALFRGPQGVEGKGMTAITEYYLASASSSGVTTATSGWTTTMQTTDTTKRYLWNYEKITYTDATTTNSTPVIIGTHGATGGAGKGISSITEYYLATSAGTGVTTATAGWTTAVQTTTVTNKYLWNYEVITYTDATTTTINPVIIGTHGATGGAGVSVSSIVEEYYRSTSNTTQTGGSWSTTVPAWLDGTYMWSRTKTTFSDATTSTTSAICITGSKGTDGTTTYTWVKYADDSAGAGLADSPNGKRYIGIAVNKTSSTESTTATDYTWSPLYDNVNVGGRNVYLDSFLNQVVSYSNSKMTRTEADLLLGMTSDTIKMEPVDPVASTNFGFYQHSSQRKLQFEAGKPYVLRFKARGNVTNFSYCYFMRNSAEGGNSNMGTYNVTLDTTAWTDVTIYKDAPFTTSTGYILLATRDIAAGKWFEVKEVMLEQGNIATPWTPAPEDIQDILDGKASAGDLEALAGIVSSVSAVANAAAGMGEFQALEAAYNARVAQDIVDKEAVAASLATMDGRVALAHTIAGDAKLVTEFISTVITESEEGIYISNGASNTGILISSNRISFMDNDIEVAYISNQTMQINHGIFVESATIADFKFEKIPGTTIMAITWVGA